MWGRGVVIVAAGLVVAGVVATSVLLSAWLDVDPWVGVGGLVGGFSGPFVARWMAQRRLRRGDHHPTEVAAVVRVLESGKPPTDGSLAGPILTEVLRRRERWQRVGRPTLAAVSALLVGAYAAFGVHALLNGDAREATLGLAGAAGFAWVSLLGIRHERRKWDRLERWARANN